MPLQILVVDDHADSASALARLLQRDGHFVATAGSKTDAIIAAAKLPQLDLLISDIELPDGNGCDLLQLLRDHKNGGPRHAVALSGHGEEDWQQRCREAGYVRFIRKPALAPLLDLVSELKTAKPRG
jgi:CheY-like chemotaxis protein